MIDYKGREVLCSVRNMEVTFGKGRKAFVAVKGVNFDIYKGETFGLVGESGSGKTTIGRAIIRINPISAGEVLFKGERISGKISKEMDKMVTQKIQMIFQDPMASLNERAKVDYIVSEGLMNVHPDMKKEEREERVSQALSDVGLLPEFATRFPHEFSGGQRQRIGIARALIMEPEFIIADEPISALDVSIRAQVLNLMSKLQKERGLTYLFIAHDLSVMRFITDRIAVIHKGHAVHHGPDRGHSQGRHCRVGRDGEAVRPSPAPLHPGAAFGHPDARPGQREEEGRKGIRSVGASLRERSAPVDRDRSRPFHHG